MQAAVSKAAPDARTLTTALEWPAIWGGRVTSEAALPWMAKLPTATPTLLLYTREQVRRSPSASRAFSAWQSTATTFLMAKPQSAWSP